MAAVTLRDVAREAGVSIATASRVLNGSGRKVAEEYREKVMEAATQLNYTPNLSAQAVVRGSTNVVTLVVPDISDPYFSAIAAGVARRAGADGLMVMIAVTERNPARETELVRSLRGQRPAVVILAGSRFVDSGEHADLVRELDAYAAVGGRVVVLGQDTLPYPAVVLDNRQGAHALAQALISQGYSRFAVLAGRPHLLTARDRAEGFLLGAAEAGAPISQDSVRHGAFTRAGGYRAMNDLLDEGLGDTELVFAVNDVMAVGALAALRERGIDVPGDIAVAGYDDIQTARDVHPPLTTVHIPLEEVGERAVELALGDDATELLPIRSQVILRGSTAR